MKVCSKCGLKKDLLRFHHAKRYLDGHIAQCKVCVMKRHRKWFKRNRKFRMAQIATWRKINPVKCQKYYLKQQLKKYGLTIPQYKKMLLDQQGKCKICGTSKPGARFKRLVVDHNKQTNCVRGLLCDRCNRGIGLLLHDILILQSAISYLNPSK